MLSDVLRLDESDIIRLILSFFDFSGLDASAAALERESGITDTDVPQTALRLREMLQKAQWRRAMEYIRSLPLNEDDTKRCLFEIMKQKYVELICIYQEMKNELFEDLGNAIAVCFSELAAYCKDSSEYENLRRIASLSKLKDDPLYETWTPFSSRKVCFKKVWDILEGTVASSKSAEGCIPPGRLLFLLVKGMLYESCEEYCKQKAQKKTNRDIAFCFGSLTKGPSQVHTNSSEKLQELENEGNRCYDCKTSSFSALEADQTIKNERNGDPELTYDLSAKGCSNDMLDYSLYSWLQTVPWVSIGKNFVHRPLNVEIKKHVKPENREGWTEQILEGINEKSDFSFQDAQEKFCNDKISKHLIVDAPEILKRAEEVVNRWEAKIRQRRAKSGRKLENSKFNDSIQTATSNSCQYHTKTTLKMEKEENDILWRDYTNRNIENEAYKEDISNGKIGEDNESKSSIDENNRENFETESLRTTSKSSNFKENSSVTGTRSVSIADISFKKLLSKEEKAFGRNIIENKMKLCEKESNSRKANDSQVNTIENKIEFCEKEANSRKADDSQVVKFMKKEDNVEIISCTDNYSFNANTEMLQFQQNVNAFQIPDYNDDDSSDSESNFISETGKVEEHFSEKEHVIKAIKGNDAVSTEKEASKLEDEEQDLKRHENNNNERHDSIIKNNSLNRNFEDCHRHDCYQITGISKANNILRTIDGGDYSYGDNNMLPTVQNKNTSEMAKRTVDPSNSEPIFTCRKKNVPLRSLEKEYTGDLKKGNNTDKRRHELSEAEDNNGLWKNYENESNEKSDSIATDDSLMRNFVGHETHDASQMMKTISVSKMLDKDDHACGDRKMLISDQIENITTFAKTKSDVDSDIHHSNKIKISPLKTSEQEYVRTPDKELVYQNFIQRKKYVMELLESKRQLREHLLRAITGKDTVNEEKIKRNDKSPSDETAKSRLYHHASSITFVMKG